MAMRPRDAYFGPTRQLPLGGDLRVAEEGEGHPAIGVGGLGIVEDSLGLRIDLQLPAAEPVADVGVLDQEHTAVTFFDVDNTIMPGITHWQSPNFFAYFPANASGPAILGELLSAGLGVQGNDNVNALEVRGWPGGGAPVENQVLLREREFDAFLLEPLVDHGPHGLGHDGCFHDCCGCGDIDHR